MSTAAPNTELAASSVPAATAVRRTRDGWPSSLGGGRGRCCPRGCTGRSSACGARPSRRSRVPTETASRSSSTSDTIGAESVAVQQFGHRDHRLLVRAPTT